MPGRLEFPASYDTVIVPAPIRTMDAIDPQAVEAEAQFFEDIIDSLRLSRSALSTFCSMRHRMLIPMTNSLLSPDQRVQESNDSLSELWFQDRQPIATVMKVRDEFNWQVMSFVKYPLLPNIRIAIAELDNLEAIIRGEAGD